MTDQFTPAPPPPSGLLRLDPSPSKMFTWLQWEPEASEIRDEASGRMIRPALPTLTVRYRTTGAEWEFWPVTESEARLVFQPNAVYDYSIGRAFSQLVKGRKSQRQVKPGERQETVRQRGVEEKRAGRRWLA
jgi:hypothetical protein